jgi:hypothetical protein
VIRVVVLDSGPLGLLTKPVRTSEVREINRWILRLQRAGVRVVVPEIADYEVRRELERAGAKAGIARLDTFNGARPDRYLALTTRAMRRAAVLWAEARNRGHATADRRALDGDVIIAAQVLEIGVSSDEIVVATDNEGHLSRYVQAEEWRNIAP